MRKKDVNMFFTADTYKSVYLKSDAFQRCRDMVAPHKCFVCQTLYRILPHHVQYKNLYNERLWRDIYPVCYWCHKQAHFVTILWILEWQIPLRRGILKKRLFYLRLKYCIRNKRFWSSLWAVVYCVFV